MLNRTTIALALAAGMLTAPAAATPTDTHPTATSATTGSGCYVHDVNGVAIFVSSCSFHLDVQTDTNGNLINAHYQDHTVAPAGTALPNSTLMRDISFDSVRCTEWLMPSGEYKSDCFFNTRSKAYP